MTSERLNGVPKRVKNPPTFSNSNCVNTPVAKAMAFGGVLIGNANDRAADIVTGTMISRGSILSFSARDPVNERNMLATTSLLATYGK